MSDLIDREKALDGLKYEMKYGAEIDICGLDTAYDIIENIPSAEPERKWIPVTERLPKDNRQVLVYAQSVHYALAKYDEMMEPDGEWKKQWVTFDAWKPYYTIKNVIAWMPLPEAWRGE